MDDAIVDDLPDNKGCPIETRLHGPTMPSVDARDRRPARVIGMRPVVVIGHHRWHGGGFRDADRVG